MKIESKRTLRGVFSRGGTLVVGAVILSLATGLAHAAWGEWREVDDQAQRGIDWRYSKGDFKYDGDAYKWSYEFRSRYAKTVKFKSVITYTDDKGTQQKSTEYWTLAPQATDSSNVIARGTQIFVQVTKPTVVE